MKRLHARIGFAACIMLASAGVQAFPPYYGGSPATNVVIDDFTAPPQFVIVPLGPAAANGQLPTPLGVSVGDFRDLGVIQPGTATSTTMDTFTPGVLHIGQGASSDATFYATWDGPHPVTTPATIGGTGVDTSGLGPIDLTSGGTNNGILVELLGVETPANEITVTLNIFDFGGGSPHTASYTFGPGAPVFPIGTPIFHFFTFEDFGYATGYDVQPGEGPTSVGAIQMVMNGTVTADGYFGAVLATQIPVPAPLALIGIGLLGLGAGRRRRAS